jgi:hypothetical protein
VVIKSKRDDHEEEEEEVEDQAGPSMRFYVQWRWRGLGAFSCGAACA